MKIGSEIVRSFLENYCDFLLPGSSERNIPKFTNLGLLEDLLTRCDPNVILRLLYAHNEIIQRTFGNKELSKNELSESFNSLLARTYDDSIPLLSEMLSLYYSNRTVIEKMNLNPSLPFPKGIKLKEMDYELLVPVVEQGRKYRIVRGDKNEY